MVCGFAGRRLWPLGYTRFGIGTRGEIRTPNILFLRQAPLPIWPRVQENWSERQDLNLRILAPKASPYGHLRNALLLSAGFGERSRTYIC